MSAGSSVLAFNRFSLHSPFSLLPSPLLRASAAVVSGQKSGLLLFVCGDNTAAAMRTLPIALLEVGARVSDLFATVLARHCDMLVFRHAARITESCLECILLIAERENGRGQRSFSRLPRGPSDIADGCGAGLDQSRS